MKRFSRDAQQSASWFLPLRESNLMSEPMTAQNILDREFLEIRAKILQLAASFDRLDRGDGVVANDPRMKTIHKGVEILQSDAPNRAEQLQLLFSREYEADWQTQFGIE